MKLSLYAILSQVILGYLWLIVIPLVWPRMLPEDLDLAILSIPFAFVMGYFINAFSSWIQPILYRSWGGKPSTSLLIRAQNEEKAHSVMSITRRWLEEELQKHATSSEKEVKVEGQENALFGLALAYISEQPNRYQEMNAAYAFSRGLIVALLGLWVLLVILQIWKITTPLGNGYHFIWLGILIAWIRTRQRGYELVKECLRNYYNFRVKQKAKDNF
ncbi:MAG: hypothetical protein AAF804_12035 [Bacteroidota bacterium]